MGPIMAVRYADSNGQVIDCLIRVDYGELKGDA